MSDIQSVIAALTVPGMPRWGSGAAGNPATVTYSFMTAAPSYASSTDATGFAPMTATQKDGVRSALAAWADVANLTFVEVADTGDGGALRFGTNVQPTNSFSYAYSPGQTPASGDVYLSSAQAMNASPTPGSAGFENLLREVGRALGLKYSDSYDYVGRPSVPPFLPWTENTTQYTVMSYSRYQGTGSAPLTGPGLYDVVAIQALYGARTSTRSGDDVYSIPTTAQPYIATIWDGGGRNTIDASGQTWGARIDLHAGAFSSIGTRAPDSPAVNNVSIAYGTLITAAVGGAGGDRLTANDDGDTLTGGGGNDTLTGGAGTDTAVFSGNAADYRVTDGGDTVQVADSVAGRDGTDTLMGIESLRFADRTVSLVPPGPRLDRDKSLTAREGGGAIALGITAPTGSSLTVTVTGLPAAGMIVLPDGRAVGGGASITVADLPTLRYLPATGAAGSVGGFTYRVTDQAGQTTSQTIALSVRTIAEDLNGFDPARYIASNADLMRAFGYNLEAARSHYISNGRFESRSTTAFDPAAYLGVNADVAAAFGADFTAATRHYIQHGAAEWRRTTGFDAMGYLATNRDLAAAFGADERAAVAHWISYGRAERRQTSFDAWAYEAANADIAAAFGADTRAAERHYVLLGRNEGRSVSFDGLSYEAANPDLIRAYGLDLQAAVRHYVEYGRAEGRPTIFNAAGYLAANSDVRGVYGDDPAAAASHYVRSGYAEGRSFGVGGSPGLSQTSGMLAGA